MSRFTIGILGRDKNQHSACFEDFAVSLADALKKLGHEVTGFGPQQGRLIVFGVNNARPTDGAIPDDTIIYNTEQMTSLGGDVRRQMENFDHWRRFTIWDYSLINAQKLRDAGAERVVHCPIGYSYGMQTIVNRPSDEQDIDVLFYGSMNPRRREILDKLISAGVVVHHLFGVYGKERDEVIARSKIVLNLHFYDDAIFEIFRVSHLLANHKCVVSEDGGKDEQLESFARMATTYCRREDIVEQCKWLLHDQFDREFRATRGFMRFCETSLIDNVRNALEQS